MNENRPLNISKQGIYSIQTDMTGVKFLSNKMFYSLWEISLEVYDTRYLLVLLWVLLQKCRNGHLYNNKNYCIYIKTKK